MWLWRLVPYLVVFERVPAPANFGPQKPGARLVEYIFTITPRSKGARCAPRENVPGCRTSLSHYLCPCSASATAPLIRTR